MFKSGERERDNDVEFAGEGVAEEFWRPRTGDIGDGDRDGVEVFPGEEVAGAGKGEVARGPGGGVGYVEITVVVMDGGGVAEEGVCGFL